MTTRNFDVIVVGSGSAGASAAIAAAQQGAKTLLVERYSFMGGISTQVLDTFYGFYSPGDNPRKVVGGVGDLVVSQLKSWSAVFNRPNTYGAGTGVTYNPELLKIAWERLATQAGVHLLYNATAVATHVHDGRVQAVHLSTRAGPILASANVFIDATGDADIAALSGAPFEKEDPSRLQAMTTTFRVCNVDSKVFSTVSKNKLWSLIDEARNQGFRLPRREGSIHRTPEDGVYATNLTRVTGLDPTDPDEITRAEVEGRSQAMEYMRFLKEMVPGFSQASIISLSTQIGIRESRRIFGEVRVTRKDVLSARHFPDAIAQCGAPIEVHQGEDTRWEYMPTGKTVSIPYRSLLPKDLENLLVAGRCFSADHDAHAALRSMAQCMAMGEAAGVAAALCVNTDTSPKEVDINALQDQLVERGAVVFEEQAREVTDTP